MKTNVVIAFFTYTLITTTALLVLRKNMPLVIDGIRRHEGIRAITTGVVAGLALYVASLILWLFLVGSVSLTVLYPASVGVIVLLTATYSFFISHEPLTIAHAIGATLIVGGVAVIYGAG